MNELEWAKVLIDHVLDRPMADPDDDLAVLARQLQRALEREVISRAIVDLARELVSPAGMVNRGVDRGLVVIERADKSDPHYRLCTALERLK